MLTYARTVYDTDYSCDMGQFKVNIVYITPRAAV